VGPAVTVFTHQARPDDSPQASMRPEGRLFMFRRIAIVAAALIAFVPGFVSNAHAQERVELTSADLTAALLSNSSIPTVRMSDLEQFPVQPVLRRSGPSALMTSLYASTAVMQALDMHSTLQAFKAGAVEGNPLMSGIVKNRGAFLATKAAVAASTIFATRHIAKRNKVAAVVTMVAINSAYAMIVRHNYNLARGR
jgi:hypothetical protein